MHTLIDGEQYVCTYNCSFIDDEEAVSFLSFVAEWRLIGTDSNSNPFYASTHSDKYDSAGGIKYYLFVLFRDATKISWAIHNNITDTNPIWYYENRCNFIFQIIFWMKFQSH